MRQFEDVAAGIARKAGAVLADYLKKEKHIRKKAPLSLLTDADLASQELIVAALTQEFPDHGILAEEDLDDPGVRPQGRGSGTRPDPKHEYLWIIDPLDGTTNFAHGYPKFAVSIAVARKGRVIAGVVYDPLTSELFSAARGEGARLNGQPIRVSITAEIDDALLATGFPYWTRERPEGLMAKFKAFALRAQGVRRAGAASLDLCDLACGRLDGFWEEGLAPWDTAAGSLIIEEAGGQLTQFDGAPFDIFEPAILASNGLVHMEMLEVLRHIH